MIKKSEDMRHEIRTNVREGKGEVTFIHMLEKEEMPGKARLAARLIIPVGGSIGSHTHDPDAEIYVILSSVALVSDNGVDRTLQAGDVMYTCGENHSISNIGETTLELIAIVIE